MMLQLDTGFGLLSLGSTVTPDPSPHGVESASPDHDDDLDKEDPLSSSSSSLRPRRHSDDSRRSSTLTKTMMMVLMVVVVTMMMIFPPLGPGGQEAGATVRRTA